MRNFPFATWIAAAMLPAQTITVLPAVCAHAPGNAAIAMPLHWSQGTMQVLVERALLPAALSQINGIRMRRPGVLGEPAYGALQRTITVQAGFTTVLAGQMVQALATNRPGLVTVFGPAVVAIGASAPHGHGDATAAELFDVLFTAPLPVPVTGSLLLEFTVNDPPLSVDAGNWVDAFVAQGGVDAGYAAPLGNGGCSSWSASLQLDWQGSSPPLRGTAAALQLTGARPAGIVFALLGLDPLAHPVNGSFFGFGSSLASFGLPDCYQWAPADALWSGTASAAGAWSFGFALPASATVVGEQVAVQCVAADTGGGTGLAVSNGEFLVLDRAAVGNHCCTVFAPGTVAVSPWLPFLGLMPVLVLDG
ncbi:MAG TPA: hypothetical protein VK348_03300 [Planctomycetota bacterium]|nr:hypothetical protein [Planctomycetota bacterium]